MAFDNRLVRAVFTYNNTTATIDNLDDPTKPPLISASGQLFADFTQNECTLQIGNLPRDLRNQLATNLTPMNANAARKSFSLYAGRASVGMHLIYQGDIVSGVPSQPPDIVMTFRSKTMYWYKQDIYAQSFAVTAPTSQIAKNVASGMGLSLNYQATVDKPIANYAYTGSRAMEVNKLGAIGGVDAYVVNGVLVVKNKGEPLPNVSSELSEDSGMIGQIELTEYGIRVKSLLNASFQLGGTVNIKSVQNPSLSGAYTIVRIGFEIATRSEPFYSIIEATRYPAYYFSSVMPT